MKNEKNKLDFFVINGNNNEHEHLPVNGYPTILLYKKG